MKSALDPQTETQPQSRRGRGEGRIWRIGRIWWIQYYVHGRQVRESSHSDRKPVAERLIRRRLGEAAAGIVTFPQSARVTYGQMRDVLLADYAANRRKWLRQRKDGGFYVCNLPELDKFFEGYRVIAITTDVIEHLYKSARRMARRTARPTARSLSCGACSTWPYRTGSCAISLTFPC